MAENIDKHEVIEEKPLDGGRSVLKKVSVPDSDPKNQVRLCLYKDGGSLVFGGNTAMFIAPSEIDRLYKLIRSDEEFFSLSEQFRKRIVSALVSS